MLIEIKCDKFKSQAKRFNTGLNVVVGSDDGGNSIGKSTFLMVVDFVFGGSDYIENSTDVHSNVGEHNIYFTFLFNGQYYYYCRNTLEKNIVYICDKNYNKVSYVSLESYTNRLKEFYGLGDEGLSFRNEIGRYFRIYGRENLQEKRPLHVALQENGASCIKSLLKLFNKYSIIEQAEKKYEELKKEKETIDRADNYRLVNKISKNQYNKNEDAIKKLKEEIETIIKSCDAGLQDTNSVLTDEVLLLKKELSKLRISRTRNINEKEKLFTYQSSGISESQYAQIKSFFPELNLRKVEEVESFHNSIKSILNSEIRSEISRYDEIIMRLSNAIDDVEKEIGERSKIQSLSKNVLLKLTSMQKQLEVLNKENELYDRYKEIQKVLSDLKGQISIIKLKNLNEIEVCLNSRMEKLNDFVYNSENKAPIIKLDTNKYTFDTPDDSGTGTSYKSMIVYDLAILESTNLPILVHDSYLLKQIQDSAIEKILELYLKVGKQIFISIDKVSSLTKRAQEIINNNQVLELAPGKELFGWRWNKK